MAMTTMLAPTAPLACVTGTPCTHGGPPGPVPGTPAPDDPLELFRRAVCERDGAAWEGLMAQYYHLVLSWVWQGAGPAVHAEDDEYWVTRTFTRFWAAVGPERFHQFPSLRALLQYLKLCARSVLLDEVRAGQSGPGGSPDGCGTIEACRGDPRQMAPDPAALVLDRLTGQEVWAAVLRVVPDENERRVAYCSFVLGLTPREIHARHPGRYAGVADVYRVKRNVVDRLRRSPAIRAFLGEHDAPSVAAQSAPGGHTTLRRGCPAFSA